MTDTNLRALAEKISNNCHIAGIPIDLADQIESALRQVDANAWDAGCVEGQIKGWNRAIEKAAVISDCYAVPKYIEPGYIEKHDLGKEIRSLKLSDDKKEGD